MFKQKNKSKNTASVNEGFLIITLTQSITPVVWRLELEKAKNASFEIQEQDDGHALTIKAPRKSVEIIGLFNEQDDAFDALLCVSGALQNNEQHRNTAPRTKKKAEASSETKSNRLIIVLMATVIVIGLFYYYWGRVIPTTQVFDTQSISDTSSDPSTQNGVPVSADDLLKGF